MDRQERIKDRQELEDFIITTPTRRAAELVDFAIKEVATKRTPTKRTPKKAVKKTPKK